MNRAAYFFLVLVVVLGAAFAGYRFAGGGAENNGPTGGTAAGLYRLFLPDTQGRLQSLAQWKGQILVLNYWATWCPPCRREIPDLARISRQFAGKGVVVVGMSIDDPDKVRSYRQQVDIPYPLLMGENAVLDMTAPLGNPTLGLPFTLVIDRQGDIALQRVGLLDPARLEKVLNDLIAGHS